MKKIILSFLFILFFIISLIGCDNGNIEEISRLNVSEFTINHIKQLSSITASQKIVSSEEINNLSFELKCFIDGKPLDLDRYYKWIASGSRDYGPWETSYFYNTSPDLQTNFIITGILSIKRDVVREMQSRTIDYDILGKKVRCSKLGGTVNGKHICESEKVIYEKFKLPNLPANKQANLTYNIKYSTLSPTPKNIECQSKSIINDEAVENKFSFTIKKENFSDKEICKVSSNPNYCYFTSAKKSGDISLCNSIDVDWKKEICLKLISFNFPEGHKCIITNYDYIPGEKFEFDIVNNNDESKNLNVFYYVRNQEGCGGERRNLDNPIMIAPNENKHIEIDLKEFGNRKIGWVSIYDSDFSCIHNRIDYKNSKLEMGKPSKYDSFFSDSTWPDPCSW